MTPAQMIEVIQAYERGEKIEYCLRSNPQEWSIATSPIWNFDRVKYRVAKPEPKKVKLYAFIRKEDGVLFFDEDLWMNDNYIRIPSLDQEVEK